MRTEAFLRSEGFTEYPNHDDREVLLFQKRLPESVPPCLLNQKCHVNVRIYPAWFGSLRHCEVEIRGEYAPGRDARLMLYSYIETALQRDLHSIIADLVRAWTALCRGRDKSSTEP